MLSKNVYLSLFVHAQSQPNEKVKLEIERDKKDIVVEIVLADRSIISGVQPDSDHTILNGLKVSPIRAEIS